jgi:hypothetical protein
VESKFLRNCATICFWKPFHGLALVKSNMPVRRWGASNNSSVITIDLTQKDVPRPQETSADVRTVPYNACRIHHEAERAVPAAIRHLSL